MRRPRAAVAPAAVWTIVLCAFAGGVGITAIFGLGSMRLQALRHARERRAKGAAALNGAIVAARGAICVAALAVGFIAMTHN
jgi:hypothetical protein